MQKIRIIAEVGENHLGDIEIARRLVKSAHRAGADFVKFQSYDYRDLDKSVDEEIVNSIKKTQIRKEDHIVLKEICDNLDIEFLSTPVNVYWAKFLKEIGCKKVKVASLSLANEKLLSFVGEEFEEVFLSTGMGTIEEIKKAINIVNNKKTTVFHCVSNYPVRDNQAQLQSITYLQKILDNDVGYSDHTIGIEACLAAASIGALVIEKHFTENKEYEGSDHILSADFKDLKNIVEMTKKIQSMQGIPEKILNEDEIQNKKIMRNLFIERD